MKVSLITVCYNNINTIKDCLLSVMSQSYHNIEYIVIDGSSDDGTIELLRSCQNQLTVLEIGKDDGIYDALNKGISHVTGDIVGILHADDLFTDEFAVENIVNCYKNNYMLDIVIGNVVFFDPAKNNIITRYYKSINFKPWMMKFGYMPAHTATFIRKTVFDKYGKYNKKYLTAGDFDLFVRLLLVHKVPYFLLDKTITNMAIGGISNYGLFSYWNTSMEIYTSLKENGISTNWIFVLIRLPVKMISKFFDKNRRRQRD